jgi:16S rRNA processing protein RimM
MGDDASALIQLGFVGAPFGVRGWVKLRSHTDPPERLLEHRRLRIGRGEVWKDYRIEASGRSGGALTAKLAGVEDRDQAQALRGAEVCVLNLDGVNLGVVQHFLESPAQVLMVVLGTQEYWIPAVPQHLRRVDLQARRVVVDWNADGP